LQLWCFFPRSKVNHHQDTWNSRWIFILGNPAAQFWSPIMLMADLPSWCVYWGCKNVRHRWGWGKRVRPYFGEV
jgi:hypothetical protein